MMSWSTSQVRNEILTNLSAVEDMFGRLRDAAIDRANSRLMPGGDPMVMLGPVADVEAMGYMRMSALMGRIDESLVDEARSGDDLESPLLFLATWADIVANERGIDRQERATIGREVKFLRDSVDWMLSFDGEGEPVFLAADDFKKRLGQVVARMEDVLYEGERDDRGAPCMRCDRRPPLVRVWKKAKFVNGQPVPLDEEAARLDALLDGWQCPACYERYSQEDYQKAVNRSYLDHAKWLSASAMEATYGISRNSLKPWSSASATHGGHVRKKRDLDTGLIVYNVHDALTKAGKLTVAIEKVEAVSE